MIDLIGYITDTHFSSVSYTLDIVVHCAKFKQKYETWLSYIVLNFSKNMKQDIFLHCAKF